MGRLGVLVVRKLKVWNGNTFISYKGKMLQAHCNVCAYSQKDAVELIGEYTYGKISLGEFRNYWAPCWGNSMDGIERERGVWIEFERDVPVRQKGKGE